MSKGVSKKQARRFISRSCVLNKIGFVICLAPCLKICFHHHMYFGLIKVIQILGFLISGLIFFNSASSYAQVAPSEEAGEESGEEAALEIPTLPSDAVSEVNLVGELEDKTLEPVVKTIELEDETDELEIETHEQKYAMDGFSVGAMYFNHNYNISAELLLNSTTSFDISWRSPDFRSAGIMARYAVLPYNKIGAEINMSWSASVNHNDVKFSLISNYRGEANLGYAFQMGESNSLYFLTGLGYQVVKGKDIENLLITGGATAQIGGGLSLGKKIDLEFIYSQARHASSEIYLQNAKADAIKGGHPNATYKSADAFVTSTVLMGRITYKY